MRPPKFVRIMTQRIKVVVVDDLVERSDPDEDGEAHHHSLLGYWEPNESLISMERKMSIDKAPEVFLHECLHAMWDKTNLDALLGHGGMAGFDEHLTAITAPILLAFLRDNPAAVKYLTATPSKG